MNRGQGLAALHRWLGLVTVLVFIATGIFMRFHDPPMTEIDPALRMLFRSRHLYLLLSGLLNLALGISLAPRRHRWARRLATVGSLLLALAPLLFFCAFVVEATVLATPWAITPLAAESALVGTLLHFVAALMDKKEGD